MPTDDAEIEAAAERAYEALFPALCGLGPLAPGKISFLLWDSLAETSRQAWRVVARAAQPPPKLCGSCRWWGDRDEKSRGAGIRSCISPAFNHVACTPHTEGHEMGDPLLCSDRFGCILHQPTEAAPDA